MELYLLDEAFSLLSAPLDEALSVVWSMRFFECGTFRAIFPLRPALFARLRQAVYLCTRADEDGFARCGRIEYVGSTGDGLVEVSGRMLECLLSDRVMTSPYSTSGSVTEAVTAAVSANLRGLPVTIASDMERITDVVTLSAEWDVLSDWLYRVLKPFGASFTVTLDTKTSAAVFRVVCPVAEAKAIFSSSFENIAQVTYESRFDDMKNVVYIEGADGTVVRMDAVPESGEKREVYQKAADIRPGDFASEALYKEALKLRGRGILGEYPAEEYISCTVDNSAQPVYGKDYHLGDCCYVEDAGTGLSIFTRVTEADEVWENGERCVYPAFGERISGMSRKWKK